LFNYSSDLFAVGAIIYKLLIGENPITNENPKVFINNTFAATIAVNVINKNATEAIQKVTSKPRFKLPPTKYIYDELDEQIIAVQ
jgi:hypothetical protein